MNLHASESDIEWQYAQLGLVPLKIEDRRRFDRLFEFYVLSKVCDISRFGLTLNELRLVGVIALWWERKTLESRVL